MLCCFRKNRADQRESLRILWCPTDYRGVSGEVVSGPDTGSTDASTQVHSQCAGLTTLSTVQPVSKEHLHLMRSYSLDEEMFRNRSGIRNRSSGPPSRSSSLRCRCTDWSRSSSIQSRSFDSTDPVCAPDTVAVDVCLPPDRLNTACFRGLALPGEEFSSTESLNVDDIDDTAFPVVCFSLEHVQHKRSLTVTLRLCEVKGLPCKSRGLLYDPVAVLTLQPGKQQVQASSTQSHTLNPRFDQEFHFTWNHKDNSSDSRWILISVFDAARRQRHMAIGHCVVPVTMEALSELSGQDHRLSLQGSSVVHHPIGQLLMRLSYSARAKRLTVGVVRGRNLEAWANADSLHRPMDLQVTVTALFEGNMVSSKKSHPVSQSPNPFINESFDFFVPRTLLEETTLVVTLTQRRALSRRVVLGRVTVGPYTQAPSGPVNFWATHIQAGHIIKDWYTLRR